MTALDEFRAAVADHPYTDTQHDALQLVKAPLETLKAAPAEERLAFVFEALGQIPHADPLALQLALMGAVSALLRSGMPLSSADAIRLLESVSQPNAQFPFKAVLAAIENVPRSIALLEALSRLQSCITEWHGSVEMRDLHDRIHVRIHGRERRPDASSAGWSKQVFEETYQSPMRAEWQALFQHARSLTQGSASRKWQNGAVALIENIGRREVLDSARRWLALSPTPGQAQLQTPETDAEYQKGFIWALGALGRCFHCSFHCGLCLRFVPQDSPRWRGVAKSG
jgi:hypothetical protein